jgi:U8 snoRNA-decapping enzyme
MGDGYRGFPVFLANKFAGNAREQLLMGIRAKNILSETEIQTAYSSYLELRHKDGIFQCDD